MSTSPVQPAPLLPVTTGDTISTDSTWTSCLNFDSCLLGRVDFNLRNISLLVSIVASVAGMFFTYAAGNLYLAAHFTVCAVVSVYTFFAMKDYELIGELSGQLDTAKTHVQTLEVRTQELAVQNEIITTTADCLKNTNTELSLRNTEFEGRVIELEQTNTNLTATSTTLEQRVQNLTQEITDLKTTKASLQKTQEKLQETADQLKDDLNMIENGKALAEENRKKVAETTQQLAESTTNLKIIEGKIDISQKQLDSLLKTMDTRLSTMGQHSDKLTTQIQLHANLLAFQTGQTSQEVLSPRPSSAGTSLPGQVPSSPVPRKETT